MVWVNGRDECWHCGDTTHATGEHHQDGPVDLLLCAKTGNLCGSDTWEVNSPCQCASCQAWLKMREAQLFAILDRFSDAEVDQYIARRRKAALVRL